MENPKRKRSVFRKALCAFLPDRCPCCDKIIRGGKLYCKDCSENFNFVTYHNYAKGGYQCISAAPYKDCYAEAIRRFKFRNRRQYKHALAFAMAKVIKEEYAQEHFDLITYVPMHRLKERERGYNQSRILARKLSDILNIPLVNALEKTRNNQPQHELKTRADREKNVKGAFRVTSKEAVSDRNILLIDDIITTGFTLGECARMLDKCKAAKILCATFAAAVAKTT